MTRRSIFLFGFALGAWVNMWFGLAGGWWSFYFAYAMVALFMMDKAFEPWRK